MERLRTVLIIVIFIVTIYNFYTGVKRIIEDQEQREQRVDYFPNHSEIK